MMASASSFVVALLLIATNLTLATPEDSAYQSDPFRVGSRAVGSGPTVSSPLGSSNASSHRSGRSERYVPERELRERVADRPHAGGHRQGAESKGPRNPTLSSGSRATTDSPGSPHSGGLLHAASRSNGPGKAGQGEHVDTPPCPSAGYPSSTPAHSGAWGLMVASLPSFF